MAALADQRQADERRHEEAMQALADQRHSLERQTASLETVIERTGAAA